MNIPMIDWQMLCLLLRTHYKPLNQIYRELKMNKRSLYHLSEGVVKNPRWDTGVSLIRLFERECLGVQIPVLD